MLSRSVGGGRSPPPLRKRQEQSRFRSFWSRPLLKGNCFPKRPPPEDLEVFSAPAIADILSNGHEKRAHHRWQRSHAAAARPRAEKPGSSRALGQKRHGSSVALGA